ncbi:MAG: PRC-barrel domain-containing protein [Phycisphaerae bacterium]
MSRKIMYLTIVAMLCGLIVPSAWAEEDKDPLMDDPAWRDDDKSVEKDADKDKADKKADKDRDKWSDKSADRDQRSEQMASRRRTYKQYQPNLMRANKMIGMQVQNEQQKNLGNIEEIVLDAQQEKIGYAVLSFGGLMGVGDKLFAVPWDAFDVNEKKSMAILDVKKQELKDAPGFDPDNWPESGDTQWLEKSEKHWQSKCEARQDKKTQDWRKSQQQEKSQRNQDREMKRRENEDAELVLRDEEDETEIEEGRDRGSARDRKSDRKSMQREQDDRYTASGSQDKSEYEKSMQYRKLSQVIGLDVKGQNNKTVGEIEDVLIDLEEGRLVYAVIGDAGFLGLGEKLSVVPFQALNINRSRDLARISADQEAIKQHAYQEGEYDQLAKKEQAQKIHKDFDVDPYWVVYGYEEQPRKTKQKSRQAWASKSEYNKMYEKGKEQTFEGMVLSTGTFQPKGGERNGLRIRMRTDDGKYYLVYAGPKEFAQQKDARFHFNDDIKVIGSVIEKEGGQKILMAKEIHKGDQKFVLRDDQGQPQWQAEEIYGE